MEIQTGEKQGITLDLPLCEQVALDLANYLDGFPNKSFAIRYLAKETGLNEKTIKRILKKENKPTYMTLFKLYTTFFETMDFEKLLLLVPVGISKHLEDFTPCESIVSKEINGEFLELVKTDPLMAELFVLAGTGSLHRGAISYRYGEYGVELVHRLEDKGFLKALDKDTWIVPRNCPNLDSEALKFLGEYFVTKFSKPKNGELAGEHIISFYAEGLNEEGKKAWTEIDTESFYKKMKIANNPKYQGDIPVFTFTATDTIRTEKQNV